MDFKGQILPALVRYAHFISLFLIVSSVVMQHLIAKGTMSKADLKRVLIINKVFGAAALIALVSGLFLWMGNQWVGMGTHMKSYYSDNPLMHIKTGSYLLLGGLSILPTIFFKKAKQADQENMAVPGYIVQVLRVQLVLIFLMPMLAVLMARGVGWRPDIPEQPEQAAVVEMNPPESPESPESQESPESLESSKSQESAK